jgi:hypothetical protein
MAGLLQIKIRFEMGCGGRDGSVMGVVVMSE